MRIYGNDGSEFRCCKTGLRIHDDNFHPDSRHAADLFFCPVCKTLLINRNDNDYFDAGEPVHLTITHDPAEPMLWDVAFAAKIKEQYNLDLLRPQY